MAVELVVEAMLLRWWLSALLRYLEDGAWRVGMEQNFMTITLFASNYLFDALQNSYRVKLTDPGKTTLKLFLLSFQNNLKFGYFTLALGDFRNLILLLLGFNIPISINLPPQ